MFSSLLSRRRLKHYETIKRVYQGDRSCVLEAVAPDQTRVIIKAYLQEGSRSRDFLLSIRREAALLKELDQPNIVKCLTSWSDERYFFLVLEHCEEGDLLSVAARFPCYCIPEDVLACKIVRPLLLALSYLHSRGIIHRDVKPENCVVTAAGVLKLIDFGFAVETRLHPPVHRVGTLEFMAPEVCRLSKTPPPAASRDGPTSKATRQPLYGAPADVWSAGCVSWELLYGAPLFSREANGPAALEREIASEEPVPLPLANRAGTPVSQGAREFLQGALEKDQKRRQTADALLRGQWMAQAAAGEEAEAAAAAAAAAAATHSVAVPAPTTAAPVPAPEPPPPAKSASGITLMPSTPTTVLEGPFAGAAADTAAATEPRNSGQGAPAPAAAASSASAPALGTQSSSSSRASLSRLADATGGVLLMDEEDASDPEAAAEGAAAGAEPPHEEEAEEEEGARHSSSWAAVGHSAEERGEDAEGDGIACSAPGPVSLLSAALSGGAGEAKSASAAATPAKARPRPGQGQLQRVVSASVLEACSKPGGGASKVAQLPPMRAPAPPPPPLPPLQTARDDCEESPPVTMTLGPSPLMMEGLGDVSAPSTDHWGSSASQPHRRPAIATQLPAAPPTAAAAAAPGAAAAAVAATRTSWVPKTAPSAAELDGDAHRSKHAGEEQHGGFGWHPVALREITGALTNASEQVMTWLQGAPLFGQPLPQLPPLPLLPPLPFSPAKKTEKGVAVATQGGPDSVAAA